MAILGRERCPSLVEQYEQLAGVRGGERLVLSLGGSTARRELVVGGGGNSFGERSNRELKMIGVRDELMIDHEWGVLVLARAITSSMISGGELCYWFEIELGG